MGNVETTVDVLPRDRIAGRARRQTVIARGGDSSVWPAINPTDLTRQRRAVPPAGHGHRAAPGRDGLAPNNAVLGLIALLSSAAP